jgi:hypothetical protein
MKPGNFTEVSGVCTLIEVLKSSSGPERTCPRFLGVCWNEQTVLPSVKIFALPGGSTYWIAFHVPEHWA